MEHGNGAPDTPLHTLIPLADFKAILGLDDREDCLDFASMRNQGYEFSQSENSTHVFQPPSLAAFCLITATYTIEQYCKRRLLRRKNTVYLTFSGGHIFTLREYPVRRVLTVHTARMGRHYRGKPVLLLKTWLIQNITIASPVRVSMRTFPSRWYYNLLFVLQGKKWGYGYGIWRGTPQTRPRLTWLRPVWNWRPGT
jgi:hypothetical protein